MFLIAPFPHPKGTRERLTAPRGYPGVGERFVTQSYLRFLRSQGEDDFSLLILAL